MIKTLLKHAAETRKLIAEANKSSIIPSIDMPSIEENIKLMSMLLEQYKHNDKVGDEQPVTYDDAVFSDPLDPKDIGYTEIKKYYRTVSEIETELNKLIKQPKDTIACNRVTRRLNTFMKSFLRYKEQNRTIIMLRKKQSVDLRRSTF